MLKRMFLMLAVMLMFIAGLGFVKFQQIQTAIAKGAAFQPPPAAVTTIVAAHWSLIRSATWNETSGDRLRFPEWTARIVCSNSEWSVFLSR
jgi:hypothetical protein